MNLHEYQAKEVFSAYGIPVPTGRVAATPDEAVAAAEALGGSIWVVKAQVHAGGRGKAGGVKLARDKDAVRAAAAAMLGTRLATKQTGPEGLPVEKVYVESGSAIDREIYLSLTLNREKGRIAMVGSAAGGMDIAQSLRTAMLWLVPTGLWATFHYFWSARQIVADQTRATGINPLTEVRSS